MTLFRARDLPDEGLTATSSPHGRQTGHRAQQVADVRLPPRRQHTGRCENASSCRLLFQRSLPHAPRTHHLDTCGTVSQLVTRASVSPPGPAGGCKAVPPLGLHSRRAVPCAHAISVAMAWELQALGRLRGGAGFRLQPQGEQKPLPSCAR